MDPPRAPTDRVVPGARRRGLSGGIQRQRAAVHRAARELDVVAPDLLRRARRALRAGRAERAAVGPVLRPPRVSRADAAGSAHGAEPVRSVWADPLAAGGELPLELGPRRGWSSP